METLSIPCPADDCGGTVTVTAEPIINGTVWAIQHHDDAPAVFCSQGCRSPVALEEPVKAALQAS